MAAPCRELTETRSPCHDDGCLRADIPGALHPALRAPSRARELRPCARGHFQTVSAAPAAPTEPDILLGRGGEDLTAWPVDL
jgi:hypothetical protein